MAWISNAIGGDTLNFYIQAGNPKVQCTLDYEDDNLSNAIETIFPLYTENAILVWNYINIPLSYKYDISYMMNDIISLLSNLQKKKSGRKIVHWLPDTFRCDWFVSWEEGELEINSKWECTVGHLEKLLNEVPNLRLPINTFVNEWKEVLNNVVKGLKLCKYDVAKIEGIEVLLECYNDMKESGILYK